VRRAVCAADRLQPGQLLEVRVDRLSLVVVRGHDGGYRVLRNVCAHQGAPLAAGRLEPLIVADAPGCYRIEAGKDVLRCPWHAYEYDIDTGRSPSDPDRVRVKSYPASVEDGEVTIEL
jgi:nitrite reductase/ring-hydroxylating ferredoxin subunit